MSAREQQAAAEWRWARLVVFANAIGTPIVCLEWWRTKERQAVLVARGASRTMNSAHIIGMARDYCFLADLLDDGTLNYTADQYKALGEFWEEMSDDEYECIWGGRFGDNPATPKIEGWDAGHFEVRKK